MDLRWVAADASNAPGRGQLLSVAAGRAALKQALDWLPQGVLMVDAAGGILYANREARDILADRDGLHAGAAGLRAENPVSSKMLRRMIERATDPSGGRPAGALALPRRSSPRPLSVAVMPVGGDGGQAAADASAPMALIFAVDPDRAPHPSATQLRQLYGLTQAEAEVAVAVARGAEVSAVAAGLGVSLATVRCHLRHVFEKTGTRRQVELVNLVLRSQVGVREESAAPALRGHAAPAAQSQRPHALPAWPQRNPIRAA